LIRKNADGTEKRIRSLAGRGGIVALAEVLERAYDDQESETENYANGTKIWWRYHAPTKSVNSAGFLDRKSVARILGYHKNYVFRGFGNGHSGLKQILQEAFERLLASFLASEKPAEDRATHLSIPIGLGGEGPVHRALKKRVSADPAGVLGEDGLTLFGEEWAFVTNDRVDVLLKDEFGRFVAVEIEVDCSPAEIAGPLQCMKYRSMLSYHFSRPLEEIHTILVAHSINKRVIDRCKRHSIETIVVLRNL
jgi:hypothetical protein